MQIGLYRIFNIKNSFFAVEFGGTLSTLINFVDFKQSRVMKDVSIVCTGTQVAGSYMSMQNIQYVLQKLRLYKQWHCQEGTT